MCLRNGESFFGILKVEKFAAEESVYGGKERPPAVLAKFLIRRERFSVRLTAHYSWRKGIRPQRSPRH